MERRLRRDNLTAWIPALAAPSSALPRAAVRRGAVLAADVSGYTSLAERLTEPGAGGAETLSELLNGYLDRLGRAVVAHGGEVTSFAGDGLLAVWPAEDGDRDAALRAAACGLAIQRSLEPTTEDRGTRLSVRIGLGLGEAAIVEVGEPGGRRFLLVGGDAARQASEAERRAQPGDVLLAPPAWDEASQGAAAEVRADGYARLLSVEAAPAPSPDVTATHSPEDASAYVPEAVLARLAAGQGEWLAELRPVTAVFIRLAGLDPAAAGGLDLVQRSVVAVLTLARRWGGQMRSIGFVGDDTSILVAFGLPPGAEEDDPVRAVKLALAGQEALAGLGSAAGIGLATGRVFCGTVEAAGRREYTVLGAPVNLAARLAARAGPGAVIADAATRAGGRGRIAFDDLPPIEVKGRSSPVAVARPLGSAGAPADDLPRLVGRETELAGLLARLDALGDGGGGVTVVEGEPGIGKSRLLAEVLAEARSRGIATLAGRADPVERTTPYHAWRPVLARLLAPHQPGSQPARDRATGELERAGLGHLAPLLNDIEPLGIGETPLTLAMGGDVRAGNAAEALAALIRRHRLREGPLLLALDDAHWFDSASWAVARRVADAPDGLAIVVTTRPAGGGGDPHPADQLDGVDRMDLGSLPPAEILDLVRRRLGVNGLPQAVVDLVLQRSEGNPFFAIEIATALVDGGALVVEERTCRLVNGGARLAQMDLPDTLGGLVASRIDRLEAGAQFTLKIASVVGRTFEEAVVRGIHPIKAARRSVGDDLRALAGLELIEPHPGADGLHAFHHAVIHEAAYGLMLAAQRERLHRAAAEWYEAAGGEPGLLARHWQLAGVHDRAAVYLAAAGEDAVGKGAYREAVGFLGDALDLDDGARTDPARRAHLTRLLGDAQLGVGDTEAAERSLQEALALLGRETPLGNRDVAIGLLREVGRQARHRVAGRPRNVPTAERIAAVEAARAMERLGEVAYFTNRSLPTLYLSVRGLNEAETAGPSPELARLYGQMTVSAALLGMPPLSRLYGARGRETAERIRDPGARGWVLMTTALVAIGRGEWRDALAGFAAASDELERIGHQRYWEACQTALGMLRAHHEGNLEAATRHFAAVAASGRRSGNGQARSWGILGEAEGELRAGRSETVLAMLAETPASFEGSLGSTEQLRAHALRGLALQRLGRYAEAQAAARQAAGLIATVPPTTYYALEAYGSAIEVLLDGWSRAGGAERREARLAARCTLAGLRRFAMVFPVGRPRLLLLRARAERLAARSDRAEPIARRAVEVAQRITMPFEEARACLELATLIAHGPAADRLRARAEQLAARMDAPGVLAA